MNIGIVGSRNFKNLDKVTAMVRDLLNDDDVVISGGARGVDSTAEKAARERGLEVIIYRPDWKKHGKRAGFLRNKKIVDKSDTIVAFWDGESKGTVLTMDLAEKNNKRLELVLDEDGY